ncbi:Pci8p KNAG_0C04230 [Huiozyma naganishii CBS 8797]|uniref:PCI domain-containing protein n=1 Tax=Huiozyma naganishii (strain ATCC MYA-139 / BCRC 22969 / CBS 8797 / KCTC 17520 / NBRC 10181 / NCYC 3082 / Yp74L-3) TaxID=1071383 RepID=J7R3X3_HUIN7|nr:hypothetical protein KNAG_0C04230 [Kazachstania naganishii CBS 8797]CCK69525.1 hypothetical protein KNAG_0C04230 [Kazachstania naganishii CBS 8797]
MPHSDKGLFYLERVAYLISHEVGTIEERRQCAVAAMNFLQDIKCFDTPHWDILNEASGLQIDKPHHVPSNNASPDYDAQLLRKVISHKFGEAQYFLQNKRVTRDRYYRQLEETIKFLILCKNFKGVEELEQRIQNIVNFPELTVKEQEACRRIRVLVAASFYMQKKFFKCCQYFFKWLSIDPDLLNTPPIPARNVLLTDKEINLMITISCLISIPLESYNDFIYLREAVPFFEHFPLCLRSLRLLLNTSFNKFFSLWQGNEIAEECLQSPYLVDAWPFAQLVMRSKIYYFYFKVSCEIQIGYLSRTLGIEEKTIREDVELLIESANLNIVIRGDTLCESQCRRLEDIVVQLQRNEREIDRRIQEKRQKVLELENKAEGIIVNNDTVNRSTLPNSVSSDNDTMDLNDLTNVSDTDSFAFDGTS